MYSWIAALAEQDCEPLSGGWLAQPINAISSLAFSLVGIVVLVWSRKAHGFERRFRIAVGLALVATGVGSFLFHGPQGAGSQLAHDATFLATIALIASADAGVGLSWPEWVRWTVPGVFILIAAVVTSLIPESTNVFTGIAAVALIASFFAIRRVGDIDYRALYAAIGVFAAALFFFVLGRTNGPLCDPGSPLQSHAVWHVLSAVAIGFYVVATSPARSGESS